MNRNEIEIIRKAIRNQVEVNNGDRKIRNGVYIYYHDNLRMDAFKVEVRDYSDRVAFFEEVLMWDDSEYYGTKGLRSVVNKLHELYPKYPIVWVDCAWYTFPMEYRFDVEVPSYLKKEWPDILTFHIEKPILPAEDSQK